MAQRLTDIDLKLHESAYFYGLMTRSEQLFNAGAHKTPMSEATLKAAREFGFQLSALLSALLAIRTYIKRTAKSNPAAATWIDAARRSESKAMRAARLLRDLNIHDQAHELARRVKFDNTGAQPVFIGPHLTLHKHTLLASDKFKGEPGLVAYLDTKSIMEFAKEAVEEHVKFACEGHNLGFYKLTSPTETP